MLGYISKLYKDNEPAKNFDTFARNMFFPSPATSVSSKLTRQLMNERRDWVRYSWRGQMCTPAQAGLTSALLRPKPLSLSLHLPLFYLGDFKWPFRIASHLTYNQGHTNPRSWDCHFSCLSRVICTSWTWQYVLWILAFGRWGSKISKWGPTLHTLQDPFSKQNNNRKKCAQMEGCLQRHWSIVAVAVGAIQVVFSLSQAFF